MKARIKATGEIFDIEGVSLRLNGKVLSTFWIDDVEILMPDLTPEYWTRLEHQYAGMAMQQLVTLVNVGYEYVYEETAIIASNFAHALIQKLKEEK